MGAEQLLDPLAFALLGSTADGTEIVAEAVHQGVSRYAGSRIHQTSALDDLRVYVRAVVGQSIGTAIGNSVEPKTLQSLVEQATSAARIAAPNTEFGGFAEPETIEPVRGFDAATAEMSAGDRAAAIRVVTDRAAIEDWTASGTYLTEGRELAVVNSNGVAAYAPSSTAFFRALPNSGAGTGYADALSYRAADIDPVDVAVRALEKCRLNHDQREIAPGEYEAIFEDLCVAEALYYLAANGFSGQAYEQGTSFMSGRMEQRVTGEHVTIWDDGTDPRILAVAVDYEGVPKRKVPLLESGIARGVAHNTESAHKMDAQSTGNSPLPEAEPSWYGPVPTNLFMAGGTNSLTDMIRSTRRGLLLTRFHYTHCPDPRRVVMTGTTRDGTFLIENGEIVGAVRNLRLTQSVPELFEGIEMLGTPRLCRDWWSSNGMARLSFHCPPIKVSRATFSSGTLF